MEKKAFLFSGQGSQFPGMGKQLYENFASCKQLYELAGDVLGFDVAKTSFEGDEDTLGQTAVAQPCIYTLSLAAYTAVKELCGDADVYAGHSLGEYAALTAAGVIHPEDGFAIIRCRAQAMQKAAEETKGAMYAILTDDLQAITSACDHTPGYVIPVNYNSHMQTVIAGEEEAAKAAADILADQGFRVVKLAVNAAFHSNLMEGAARQLEEKISGFHFGRLQKTFYSNVTGNKVESIEDLPAYLANHMVSPVRFTSQLEEMNKDKIETFIELGPGKTLCGLVRKTLKGVKTFNVQDVDGLKKLEQAFTE